MSEQNNRALTMSFRLLTLTIAVIGAFALHLPLFAVEQEEPIVISAQSDKQEMLIGDTLNCTITVEWQKGIEVTKVEPSTELGIFEIQNVQESPEKKIRKGRFNKTFTFTLSTFDTGNFEIPAFRVYYKTADGKEKQADSQPISITVNGVLDTSDQRTDVRDIKPPLAVPADTRLRNILIAIAVAIILLGSAIAYYVRKRILARRAAATEEWIPPKPIEELALDELNALEASDLLDKGRIKEYYTHLSEIIRVYLGRRHRFAALDMTSFEILNKLTEFTSDESLLELIEGFFEACDLVKFAKFIPPKEDYNRSMAYARRIVELTMPKPVAEEGEPVLAAAEATQISSNSSDTQEKAEKI